MAFPALARPRVWFQARWPFEVTADQLAAALGALNGLATPRRRDSLVVLAVGRGHKVTHYLAVREPRAEAARRQLEAAIPGLALLPVDQPVLEVDRCWRAWISTNRRPLSTSSPEATARGLLTALASANDDEVLVAQWMLGPVHRPQVPRSRRSLDDLGLGVPDWLADAVTGPTTADDPEARAALVDKQGQPGWKAVLHLGVGAVGRRRQRQLLGAAAGALRVAQAPGAQIGFRPAPRWSLARGGRLPRLRPLLVNVAELRGLAGWPLGATEELPVDHERSRLLRPSPLLTHTGRVVAVTTYPGAERPLGLSAADALHHLYALGPTGVGKTTLLTNLICQDVEDGRSVVVIEPRGDLVADILARVPAHRLDDVVVIDPTDPSPVGVNPLGTPGLAAELRVDHLVTVFKGLWADSWGPRTEDILTAGLLTLARRPGMSLAALPLLFTNPRFRDQLTTGLDDPLGLGPFWSWFEDLGDSERATVLAPVMNKVRAFLLRERLRRVVGQPTPGFDMRDIYRRRTVLLVNLSTGAIGPDSAGLLGSLLVSQLWQTFLGRARVPVEARHPVMVYIDEFQNYLHLPTDLADVLTQARGLGVGLTLAHQHLSQLHPAVRAAVLANARSRVIFATNHDDAQALVRNAARLSPADVVGLGRFAVYASLLADGETTPWTSARTLPAPPALRTPDEVRARSQQRWGTPADVIDAQLEALAAGQLPHHTPTHPHRPDGSTETFVRIDTRTNDEKETAP